MLVFKAFSRSTEEEPKRFGSLNRNRVGPSIGTPLRYSNLPRHRYYLFMGVWVGWYMCDI